MLATVRKCKIKYSFAHRLRAILNVLQPKEPVVLHQRIDCALLVVGVRTGGPTPAGVNRHSKTSARIGGGLGTRYSCIVI
jgi:hypothetical protein